MLPYRKGEAPARTVTQDVCGVRISQGNEMLCFAERSYQFSDGTRNILTTGYVPEAFDTDQAWSASLEIAVAGATAQTLSRESLLLFLCAHGAKHLWERLGWVCDTARLLQVETEIDWACVFAEASRTGTSRIVAVGLLLASDWLGVALPAQAVERAAGDGRAREVAAEVRGRFENRAPIPVPALEAARLSLRIFERTGQRVRYVFGSLCGPSEAEYRALRLPPSLYGLYYVFRPLRLMAKYVRHAGRRFDLRSC